MQQDPFLKQVAETYLLKEKDALNRICFVTPNKRSATFLRHYFSEASNLSPLLLPQIFTISDLVAEWSEGVIASKFELLFLLYGAYNSVVRGHQKENGVENPGKVDFNKFQYWGGILLNDFSDVDKYLIDAAQIFKNVTDLKEISANYLTEKQIEVIRKYWKEEDIPEFAHDFWNHVTHSNENDDAVNKKKASASFVKLWQVMYDVYIEFRRRLKKDGFMYEGMAYREVCDVLAKTDDDFFGYERFVFVGFNVLSAAESKIFSLLQKRGLADFYWDVASPVFARRRNTATRFLKSQVKDFPSRYEIAPQLSDFPKIDIVAVPSAIGQTKVIYNLVKKLHPEIADYETSGPPTDRQEGLIDTAVVLPDERLCLPLLESLPESLNNINVTMGLPVRNAPVSTLMRRIVSMQLRARLLRSENTFFYEDVLAVVSHPLVKKISPDTCNAISELINERRLFNIPVTTLTEDSFAIFKPIFTVVSNHNDPDAVLVYLKELTRWLRDRISVANEDTTGYGSETDSEDDIDTNVDSPTVLDVAFLNCYLAALEELHRLERKYLRNNAVYLGDKTVFHLVERIMGHQTLAFEGVPLKGLQIMGVLETRNLDFKNLIIPSMNERVFPRRHYAKSMIPNALRSAYGMATLERQESIYAYYFYRMISRAEKVILLYDGRNAGVKSGQPSRYISQLRFIVPQNRLRNLNSSYDFNPNLPAVAGVEKTDDIMLQLEEFRKPDGTKFLSASAINMFINCPLQFYLRYVARFKEAEELKDYMDEATYGTIIHEVVELIYSDELKRSGGKVLYVDEALLNKFSLKSNIEPYLVRAIKTNYLKVNPQTDTKPLIGTNSIFLETMTRSIQLMFNREKALLPFKFAKAEIDEKVRLEISPDLSVNLSFRIDRLDMVPDSNDTERSFVRIIDYKTGGDESSTVSIEALFDPANEKRNKAILQLLLYANAYAAHEGFKGRIQPMIYRMRRMAVDPIKPLNCTSTKTEITDYRDVNEQFMAGLENTLRRLFSKAEPFMPNPSRQHCQYCQYQAICENIRKPSPKKEE